MARLRAAGCVFAEDEAAVLERAAGDRVEQERLVARRLAGEPLEHVVGEVAFGGLRLSVGPGVFVPRQRSLLLAQAALRAVARQAAPVVVEAFAGVAPLLATLAAWLPKAEMHATEADQRALDHAARNVPRAGLHTGDVLHGLPERLRGRVTLLVAVPPYVPSGAVDQLTREARYEPDRALFGGLDGLDRVRALVDAAPAWLTAEGQALLELHRTQTPSAVSHARGVGFATTVRVGRDGQTAVLRLRVARTRPGGSSSGCEPSRSGTRERLSVSSLTPCLIEPQRKEPAIGSGALVALADSCPVAQLGPTQ